MFNPEIFAVAFARAVALLRASPPNKDHQKASLRAIYALTSLASATVRLYDGVLSVDGAVVPGHVPSADLLVRQLEGHGVAELAIARGAAPTELLALLRALAADVGSYVEGDGVARRLAEAGASGIAVLAARPVAAEPGQRAPSVTQAFELADIEAAVRAEGGAAASAVSKTEEPGPVAAAAGAPMGSEALQALVAELAQAVVGGEVPGVVVTPPPAPMRGPLEGALAAVTRDPYGEGILAALTRLAQEIAHDFQAGWPRPAAEALAAVIGLEPGAPEGSVKESYALVVRTMLTRDALWRVAALVADPGLAPMALAVLLRGSADASEVLVDLVAGAESVDDRRAYLGALRRLPQGAAAVSRMLAANQWTVVRDVAELVGELRVEDAVPALGTLLAHYEPRVRRTAVVALAHIGTAATVDLLRRTLHEGSRETRILVAGGIGGPHARALAMPLLSLAEQEADAEVHAEYFRALGRIGSPEAVAALVAAAQPGGRLFGRRAAAPRIVAVEGLKAAGGSVARRALEALRDDGDGDVREAVVRALSVLVGRAGTRAP
jgi:hypothetical protein